MDPRLEELIRLARQSIFKMEHWMTEHVRGFHGFTEDERRSFANELGLHLFDGTCPCGLKICANRHKVEAWDTTRIHQLSLFVERAVIGPTGCEANSIAQGMLYRLILNPGWKMLVAKVELKRCQVCGHVYEEWNCIHETASESFDPSGTRILGQPRRCPGTFTPADTELVAQPRLIIEGIYVSLQRWLCGTRKDDKQPHYYAQRLCLSDYDPATRQYRTVHSDDGSHDHCPWTGCPRRENSSGRAQRHGQNSSTLWVRRELLDAYVAPLHDPENQPAAFAAGLRRAVRDMQAGLWNTVSSAMLEDGELKIEKEKLDSLRLQEARLDPMARVNDEDCYAIFVWLFGDKNNPLHRNDRAQIQRAVADAIRKELDARGIDI